MCMREGGGSNSNIYIYIYIKRLEEGAERNLRVLFLMCGGWGKYTDIYFI